MPIILACHTFSCQTCNTSVHCMLIAHSITSRNFQSKNWFCKMLTLNFKLKQGFLSMKLIQRGLFRVCFSTILSEKSKQNTSTSSLDTLTFLLVNFNIPLCLQSKSEGLEHQSICSLFALMFVTIYIGINAQSQKVGGSV